MRFWSILYCLIVLAVLAAIFAVALPYVTQLWPPINEGNVADSGKISTLATYASTIVGLLTFFVILGAAFLTLTQVSDIAKSRKLALMQDLHRTYGSQEMGQAVHTVYNVPPEEINSDPEKQNQRRMVSDFWNWAGWMVREKLVDSDLIYARFQSAPLVWEKLEAVELIVRKVIERRDHPSVDDQEIERLAKEHVDGLPAAWLYRLWKKKHVLIYR